MHSFIAAWIFPGKFARLDLNMFVSSVWRGLCGPTAIWIKIGKTLVAVLYYSSWLKAWKRKDRFSE
jgi:hypothetical protein